MRLLRYLLPLAGAVALVSSGAPAHAQGAHPSVLGLSGERVRLIEREALRKLRESKLISAGML